MKLGSNGALVPVRGFSRSQMVGLPSEDQTAWRSHDGLLVISSLVETELPGSGQPPKIGPTWHVSVSRGSGGRDARCRVTNEDLARVVEAFEMPAFDEDNHHPGKARHLFCPVAEEYRGACECKTTEVVIDDDGYVWTTEEHDCRGCWYARRFGLPCTIHGSV